MTKVNIEKGFSLNDASKPKKLNKRDVLNKLLNTVSKLDFNECYDDNGRLIQSRTIVVVVDNMLNIAKANKWSITKENDFIFIYNGEYWSLLDEGVLKDFLSDIALKSGVDKILAIFYEFKDKLYKQFLTSARLDKPENNKEVLINLLNGTFAITEHNQQLREFKQNDFLKYQLPFEYNKNAKAPIFEKFLNEVLPNQEKQTVLAEYIGYVFTKHLKLEKTLLLYGVGANGKSVFYDIITALIGNDNISNYSLQSLTDEKGYQRAMISNKLLNYASEISTKIESSTFKSLTSNEPIEARLPYGKPFIITDYAKLIFNTNELPETPEHTNAFFRRFLIIHFDKIIAPENQDKELAKKIINSELAGVFNWVLTGLKRVLKQRNFTYSKAIEQQINEYKIISDSVAMFVKENNYKPSNISYKAIAKLYPEYRDFCIDDGYRPVAKKNFSKRLQAQNIIIQRKNMGNVAYLENV